MTDTPETFRLATWLAWNIQPDGCTVFATPLPAHGEQPERFLLWSEHTVPGLTPPASDSPHPLQIGTRAELREGKHYILGYNGQDAQPTWRHVRFEHGQLWTRSDVCAEWQSVWNRGWTGSAADLSFPPFGLSCGLGWGVAAERSAAAATWEAAHRGWTEPRDPKEVARSQAQPKGDELVHLVARLPAPCKVCGDFVWTSVGFGAKGTVGWDAEFCKACDKWLFWPGSNEHGDLPPEFPSEIPWVECYVGRDDWHIGSNSPALPLPGRDGEPGVGLFRLDFGDEARPVLLGLEIRPGSASNPNAYAASRLRLIPRGRRLAVELAREDSNAVPVCDNDALLLGPGCVWRVMLADEPDRWCLLRFNGLSVELLGPTDEDGCQEHVDLLAAGQVACAGVG